jgi:hypothetical protein
MPIMTRQHWKSQTSRGVFTPRSKKLEAIDDAFTAYENALKAKTGTTKVLVALFDAVLAWVAKKGDNWKTSTRNSKIEMPGGKGTVETLLNQLIEANQQFRMKASPYLGKVAVIRPVVVVEMGAKVTQKDDDGGWHDIPIQTKDNSCGPCSVRMVIKKVKNEDVGEDLLRELVELAEEGGDAYGGTLGTVGVIGEGGAHDWSPSGGGTWMVPGVLQGMKIPVASSTNPKDLLLATKSKPAIAVVEWTPNGGLHYVVVLGPNTARDRLMILDPFFGVQSAPISGGTPGTYAPINHNTKQPESTARWYPWVCRVS